MAFEQAGGARPRQKNSMLLGQPGLQETSSQNPMKTKTQIQRNHSHPQGPEGGHVSPKDVSNKQSRVLGIPRSQRSLEHLKSLPQ